MGLPPLLHRLFLRPAYIGSLDEVNHFLETE